ncbi:hypothetical protein [Luteimonas suaedae]|uniref:hypothetical protein n=1 Tax=Luteimonas suaedae TaxID=2605430 RepID=UPI0011EFBC27|nr:hypothetical protein [Luteimonas suaedae]
MRAMPRVSRVFGDQRPRASRKAHRWADIAGGAMPAASRMARSYEVAAHDCGVPKSSEATQVNSIRAKDE